MIGTFRADEIANSGPTLRDDHVVRVTGFERFSSWGGEAMTRRLLLAAVCGAMVAGGLATRMVAAQEPGEDAPLSVELRSVLRSLLRPEGHRRFEDFRELTKGAKTYEGFLTLHEKDQHLYAEIKPQQL